jgi:uncharacterized membrane protein YphA (DoxX/SURF4 family)
MPAIPDAIIYAGLAGTFLALIVATAQQNWQWRVFFLLALRLAIGWHFLFEGLNKIHSHVVGPTETSKPFTSEPYFAVADGPLGPLVRKQAGIDYDSIIATTLTPDADKITTFAALSPAEQAKLCPQAVAERLAAAAKKGAETIPALVAQAEEQLASATAKYNKAKESQNSKDLEPAKKTLDNAKKKVQDEKDRLSACANEGEALKMTFARWFYGVDRRDAAVNYVQTDVPQSLPERLEHLKLLKKQVEGFSSRGSVGLGNGYGYDVKKSATARIDLYTAQKNLVTESEAFVNDLVKYVSGEVPVPAEKRIVLLDIITMWTITLVGAGLLFGFLTPLACVVGAGFLLMTYLTHPPFPWLQQPPNTEGNPLFVNKNLIELLALLVLAVHPTGRWLGIDAICSYLLRKKSPDVTTK